ncbi:hypothetical protein GGS21DRAFT_537704 [Xylaria nigripes]|nr:hypothetical protein GGS21DRAFT_537704 [Xylaria nigripes]
MLKLKVFHLFSSLSALVTPSQDCLTDEDCSPDGICSQEQHTCIGDAGWRAEDCSELGLYPAMRWSGYNHTNATSHIIQVPTDKKLLDLKPSSIIIRAESRTGSEGPYMFVQTLFGTFHHNLTTIQPRQTPKYILYRIGRDIETPNTCTSQKLNNTIWVTSTTDLQHWEPLEAFLNDVTNPAPWPLWSQQNLTHEMRLGVKGNSIYTAHDFRGPYDLVTEPHITDRNKDLFLWQNKRGNWHFLVHYMIEIDLGLKDPRLGVYVYARHWRGPWMFNNNKTLAYKTTVEFADGTSTIYYRRQRPKLHFSDDDGDITPLYIFRSICLMGQTGRYRLIYLPYRAWCGRI